MEKKSNIPLWLSILMAVLLAYSLVDNIIGLVTLVTADSPIELPAMIIFNICSCVCALVYCVMGSGKKASGMFRLFCAMYTLSFLFTCLLRAMDSNQLYLLASLLSFGLTLTYTLGENFGKKKSYFIAIVIVVCAVVDFITSLSVSCTPETVFHLIGELILASTFCIQVIAKYMDKEARGTN